MNPERIIQKYYSLGTELYHILLTHSRQVCEKALTVARKHPELNADQHFIKEASMLHDIGIFLCNAPRIHCHGEHHYLKHGYLGAELLRNEGFDQHALVCERHTGVGITLQQIIERNLPLPHRNMQAISIEEKIICYADKFFSKTELQTEHSIERIHRSLRHHGEENVKLFEAWHQQFK
jgi:uncharacterized protein